MNSFYGQIKLNQLLVLRGGTDLTVPLVRCSAGEGLRTGPAAEGGPRRAVNPLSCKRLCGREWLLLLSASVSPQDTVVVQVRGHHGGSPFPACCGPPALPSLENGSTVFSEVFRLEEAKPLLTPLAPAAQVRSSVSPVGQALQNVFRIRPLPSAFPPAP